MMPSSPGPPSPSSDAYAYAGASGGLWGAASNWTTAGGVASGYVPGASTPVAIAGAPGGAFTVVAGGGAAARLSVVGDAALAGAYAVGAALTVGAVSLAPGPNPQAAFDAGALVLIAGGTLSAGDVAVACGTLSVATQATLAAGSVAIGSVYGPAYGAGSAIFGAGPAGTLTLQPGAALADAGALALAQGTLAVTGARAAIGAALTLGVAEGPVRSATPGVVLVTAGGTLSLAGAARLAFGALLVGGAGSRFATPAALTVERGAALPGYGAGAALAAAAGGAVQLGGLVLAGPGDALTVAVDGASSIEVGDAGGAAPGALTVDAGRSVVVRADAAIAGAVVDRGTVAVDAGTLRIAGPVSGGGVLRIGAGAALALGGDVAAGASIVFAGAGGTLSIGAGVAVGAVIAGFAVGDGIATATPVSAARWDGGTLTLLDGDAVVATLALAGDFTGQTFLVAPTAGNGAAITPVAQVPARGDPPAPGSDGFAYSGASGGDWSTASNWTTGGHASRYVPGTTTPVAVTGPSGNTFMVLTGGGVAARLSVAGGVALDGSYAVGGAVTMGAVDLGPQVSPVAGRLALAAGGTLAAASVAIADGTLTAATGAAVVVAGVTIGGASSLATGAFALLPGARLSDSGALALAQGTLAVAGAQAVIGGALDVGVVAGVGTSATAGLVRVTAGGTLTVAGAVRIADGALLVDGVGAWLSSTAVLAAARGVVVAGVGADAVLVVTEGGAARIGGLALDAPAGGVLRVVVDALSQVEIGDAGGGAAGALTVDAGRAATAGGDALISGAVLDHGTIAADAGTLTLDGTVRGDGVLRIGEHATLAVRDVAAGLTIDFAGAGGTLSIGGGAAIGARITGLRTGDSITTARPVSAARWDGATGTLTLLNGDAVVGTLSLAGDFAAETFLVAPTGNNGAAITPVARVPEAVAPPSPKSDAYAYAGASGGLWGAASNWTTAGGVASGYVPGASTPVAIAGAPGGAFTVVAGGGAAARLSVVGDAALAGAYAVGAALTVGAVSLAPGPNPQAAFDAGALVLIAGGTLSAGDVAVACGTLSVATQATLAAGSVAIGSVYGPAYGAGSAIFGAGPAGTLTLQPGAALADAGALALAQGTLAVTGARAAIGAALTLGVAEGPVRSATPGVVLVTAGGTLSLAGAARLAFGALLVGGAGSRFATPAALTVERGAALPGYGAGAALAAAAGGAVQLGGLVLAGPGDALTVAVDGASSIEVGDAGGAASGALTVDAGRSVVVRADAAIAGAVVDRGTVAVDAGTLRIAGPVSGGGVLRIGAGAALALGGDVAAGASIVFTGAGGTLSIGPGVAVGAVIAGFAVGDGIATATPVSAARWDGGTLTLLDGDAVVATLALAGDFTGQAFLVAPTAGNGAAITPIQEPHVPPPSILTNVLAADAAAAASPDSVVSVAIRDSAANVSASIDALQTVAVSGKLASVALTDPVLGAGGPTLTVTAVQLAADALALAAIATSHGLSVLATPAAGAASVAAAAHVVSVAVTDTASHVQASLTALQAVADAGALAAIQLTDQGTPTLSVTAGQFAAQAGALSRIVSPHAIAVVGVAAGEARAMASAAHVASVAVTDTAGHVQDNLDALQSLAAAGTLASIAITDPGGGVMSVTAAQLARDAAAIALLGTGVAFVVTDVAAADATAIAARRGVGSVVVRDSAAGVSARLDELQTIVAAGELAAIALVDGAAPLLTISAPQLTRDAAALGRIAGAFRIAVSGAPAAYAAPAAVTSNVASVAVVDSAAAVAANLDALQSVAEGGVLTGISLADAGTPSLGVTAPQVARDAAALGAIAGAYRLDVRASTAAAAAAVAAAAHVATVSVADTVAQVQANLEALEGLARANLLGTITLADDLLPTFTLGAARFAAAGDALAHVAGGFAITVTDATAAAAPIIATAAHVTAVSVTDGASGVVAALDALEATARSGRLGDIRLTDPSPAALALSGAQLAGDADALAHIRTPYATSVAIRPEESGASVVLGSGANTVVAAAASASILTGADGALLFLGAGTAMVTSRGADTVVGGGGSATVSAAASSPLVFALGGPLAFIGGSGAATVISGVAGTTMLGGTGPTLLFSDGATHYVGGGGVDTVVGLEGSLTVQAAAGGGVFFGGTAGANQIVAGDGDVTAIGAGSGDVISAQGAGMLLAAGGRGAETLTGAGSTGANTFFAGPDDELLAGGSGNTALVAGPGRNTLAGGEGLTLFLFVNGRTGGADTITGWEPGHDFVKLAGYTTPTAEVLRHASVVNGSTALTLSDGTRITFAGVTKLSASSFT